MSRSGFVKQKEYNPSTSLDSLQVVFETKIMVSDHACSLTLVVGFSASQRLSLFHAQKRDNVLVVQGAREQANLTGSTSAGGASRLFRRVFDRLL